MIRQIALVASLAGAAGLMVAAGAQPEGRPPAGPDLQNMGQTLITGLQNTEGCLGVEAAEFPGGRRSIFAWFENKAAAERWYYSPTHQFMMNAGRQGVPEAGGTKPMAHVPDDVPIMVIATINFAGKPAAPGPIPFSEIAIELYTPLPGGAFVNKRLAPEGFEVPHMKDFSPEPEPDAAG